MILAGKDGEQKKWRRGCVSPLGEKPSEIIDAAFRLGRRGHNAGVDWGEDILTFARERLGFVPEEAQVSFLASQAKRGIVNCCRQFGKSTIMAIKALHRALREPGCLVLVAAPTERQSGLFLNKVERMAAGQLGLKVARDRYHALSLKFPNGSTIVGLPGNEENIRGFSAPALVIIDEAARVPDAMYKALRPMLVVGKGDLWLLSTPNGRQGFFFEEWMFGGERWERIQVDAGQCPGRISAEDLEAELAAMGAGWVRQEFFCEFVETGGEMFDRVSVEDCLDDDLEPLGL